MTNPRYRPALWAALLICCCALVQAGPTARSAVVDFVLDGDSLVLAGGQQVRLSGINAPEFGKHDLPDEPLAQEARAALRELVQGKTVTLVSAPEPYDRYGRLLAHVWLPQTGNVQEMLLRRGLAVMVAIPPNIERLGAHQAAEQTARAARLGMWAHPYYVPIAAERLRPVDTGFRFVSGHIRKIWRSEQNLHLLMSARFRLLVSVDDLGYFERDPTALRGRHIVARGWVTGHGEELHMRVRHPAMLTLSSKAPSSP